MHARDACLVSLQQRRSRVLAVAAALVRCGRTIRRLHVGLRTRATVNLLSIIGAYSIPGCMRDAGRVAAVAAQMLFAASKTIQFIRMYTTTGKDNVFCACNVLERGICYQNICPSVCHTR